MIQNFQILEKRLFQQTIFQQLDLLPARRTMKIPIVGTLLSAVVGLRIEIQTTPKHQQPYPKTTNSDPSHSSLDDSDHTARRPPVKEKVCIREHRSTPLSQQPVLKHPFGRDVAAGGPSH
ncbi:hypothetical protein AVEN_152128-1 [Araneus ventricosus]|uniref:Uncharacterized protein n=1 Tax=Araneus ventricosus TaxID=182803 RepID=A0A4Y2IXN0_ARAVE|nr:hypothetical protein AVEN_152128-1 [Araneus ventricosus]